MQEIIKKIIESIESGNFLFVVIFAVIALLMNLSKIQAFIDSRKKRKIENIKEALESNYVNDSTKNHLKELIETEYFNLSTGIYLEKDFREALIKLHQNYKGELRFVHFKRAIPHLEYKKQEIKVNITTFEKFLYYFNIVFGALIGIYALTLVLLPSLFNDPTFVQVLSMYGLAGFFLFVSLFMVSQTFPVISARKIEKWLVDIEQLNSEKANKT